MKQQFKRSLLSVALASALQTVAAGAYAAEEADATAQAQQGEQAGKKEEEAIRVEVTGIRAGIEKSIDTKRESTEIVESISAEDIGKLPDVSIAESIARLPGLTAQRFAGRAQTIQIRGLSDDFSTTTLNGREQVSTGQNRGVEFDQYPSELLSAVKVYKTPSASLIGQGLSGTVDLQTVSPLSYAERVVSVNGRLQENSMDELNSGTDTRGNRLSLSYIDQFADNTVGLAIGFAHLDTPGQIDSWEGYSHGRINVDGEDAVIIGASKAQALSSENERDGLMAVLEFKPNDSYRGVVDVYYSKFEQDETLSFIEAQLYGAGWAGVSATNPVVEDGRVVSTTFENVAPIVRNDNNTREDKIQAIGFRNEFTFDDDWSGVLDLSFSKAEREEMILETYSGQGPQFDGQGNRINRTTVAYTLTGNDHPIFEYGRSYDDPANLVLGDIGGWGQAGYVKYPNFEDELKSVKVSARRTFAEGMFSSLDLGVNMADREKSRGVAEQFLRLGTPINLAASGLSTGIADISMSGNSNMVTYDAFAALNSGIYTLESNNANGDVRNKQWTVNEEITTAYAQLNLDTEIGSMPLRGNVGVQMVRVDQSSDGFTNNDGANFSNGDSYSDTLPSLNLSLEVIDDHVVRLGLARQMARPRMDDLRANIGVGINTSRNPPIWSGGGGNPTLKPWEADAADLSYEIYFGEKGYVSAAYFYKDLKTYIYNQTIQYDFSGIDTSGYDPDDLPDTFIGELTAPANGEGGTLKGWEVAASVPLNLVTEALDGFGVMASYTDNESSIQPDGPGTSTPLPGYSEEVSNITFYYENEGFSARISQRSRSDFLGEVTGFGADRVRRYIKGEDIVDLQFGYAFGEGSSLDGLSLLLQVNNLTEEPYREYDPNNGDLPLKYQEYGKTILAGVNYKF